MACLNCEHTMQAVHLAEERRVYWCPRCGTLKNEDSSATGPESAVPMLVERSRALFPDLKATYGGDDFWGRVRGFTEAVTGDPNAVAPLPRPFDGNCHLCGKPMGDDSGETHTRCEDEELASNR